MSDSGLQINPFSSYSGVPSQAKFIPVIPITATATLLPSQSGSIIKVTAGGNMTITLPAVQAGLNYKIVLATAPAANLVTVTGGAGLALLKGFVCGSCIPHVDGTTGSQNLSLSTNSGIVTVANLPLAGDSLDFVCDGTWWYISGGSARLATQASAWAVVA